MRAPAVAAGEVARLEPLPAASARPLDGAVELPGAWAEPPERPDGIAELLDEPAELLDEPAELPDGTAELPDGAAERAASPAGAAERAELPAEPLTEKPVEPDGG